MKRVLTVGLKYTGKPVAGVEFENLGLCNVQANKELAAFALYEYDVIVINPESFSHFIFGAEGEFSNSPNELGELKRKNNDYDLDSAYHSHDREQEMKAALKRGATVVWCLSEPRRMNFFGFRETWSGYAASEITNFVRRGDLQIKKGRSIDWVNDEIPFTRYFGELKKTGWTLALGNAEVDGYETIASTPEEYSLGGRITVGKTSGWIVSPPSSQAAANRLILDALNIEKDVQEHEKYHGIFVSHTGKDKPFVRQLAKDLKARGVPKVWVDEAEIEIGDSLTEKIDQGMQETRFIGVVLSAKSIAAPWVKKELDIAMNREISEGEVVVLPLLIEKCDIPRFLSGKLYADFTDNEQYEESLKKLLRKLRIK